MSRFLWSGLAPMAYRAGRRLPLGSAIVPEVPGDSNLSTIMSWSASWTFVLKMNTPPVRQSYGEPTWLIVTVAEAASWGSETFNVGLSHEAPNELVNRL